jgi:hypothetical protein
VIGGEIWGRAIDCLDNNETGTVVPGANKIDVRLPVGNIEALDRDGSFFKRSGTCDTQSDDNSGEERGELHDFKKWFGESETCWPIYI